MSKSGKDEGFKREEGRRLQEERRTLQQEQRRLREKRRARASKGQVLDLNDDRSFARNDERGLRLVRMREISTTSSGEDEGNLDDFVW
ncbi:hypothetical protein BVRB_1g010930 [Beta vulgaris subsp. vulgaris]|nr:hypothetical protein BVRB_1g010930 [Beta vulgaris subsp. vulgaris]